MDNINQVVKAGATCLVAGSSVYATGDPISMIAKLKDEGSR
jgi:pentose-5-phosphate-3-epimerase